MRKIATPNTNYAQPSRPKSGQIRRTRRASPNLFCNSEETFGGRIVSSKSDSFDCNTDTRQQEAFDIRAWFNDVRTRYACKLGEALR